MSADKGEAVAEEGRSPWWGRAQLGLVLAIVAGMLWLARAPGSIVQEVDDRTGQRTAPPEVSVVLPVVEPRGKTVALTGSIFVGPQVSLVPETGGKVVSVSASLRPGGTFAAGDVLFAMETEDLELAVEAAVAEVERAEARQRQFELEAAKDRAEFRRSNPGAELPEWLAETPKVDKAAARVKAAKVGEKSARLALSRAQFRLPFAGKVLAAQLEVGQVVSPFVQFGAAHDKNALEMAVQIAPDDLAYLDPVVGRGASIVAEGRFFDAEVVRVAPVVDMQSRFASLMLRFADDVPLESVPAPGTFIVAVIQGPAFDDAFSLPESAEQRDGSVWVVDGGALRAVTPRTLARTGNTFGIGGANWLVAAFDAGDGVVLGSVFGAHDGMKVVATPTES